MPSTAPGADTGTSTDPAAARTGWLVAGGLLSAGLASACCLGPAVLGLVGLGSLGAATALEPYRPYLVTVAVALLVAAFVKVYRRGPEPQTCCGTASSGNASPRARPGHVALWVGTAGALILIGYPYLAGLPARSPVREHPAVTAPSRVVTLAVQGMTCESCTTHVRKALLDDRAVLDAQVSYANGIARVEVRSDAVDPRHLAEVVRQKTPYRASVVANDRGGL